MSGAQALWLSGGVLSTHLSISVSFSEKPQAWHSTQNAVSQGLDREGESLPLTGCLTLCQCLCIPAWLSIPSLSLCILPISIWTWSVVLSVLAFCHTYFSFCTVDWTTLILWGGSPWRSTSCCEPSRATIKNAHQGQELSNTGTKYQKGLK